MHWARWGDPDLARPLPAAARDLVELVVGPVREHDTVALAEVRLPPVGLAAPLLEDLRTLVGAEHVHTDPESRIRHTRGKSTPDLLRIRGGDAEDAPDAVVRPAGHDQVAAVVRWCAENRVALVPFGGGTSVVGGLVARRDGFAGVLAMDLGRLDRLLAVDAESMTATLEAGLLGSAAEALLAEHGLTLGHFPQSFRYASIGGFAATRSSGQASSGYGRFDALVTGLTVATPLGDWELGSAPASAAGPDLRQLVLGSEGSLGVITSVGVRVRRRPEETAYRRWRFGSFQRGVAAMRALAQSRLSPTVLRLSDETETMVNLTDPSSIGAADGASESGGALLVAGVEGDPVTVRRQQDLLAAVLGSAGGTDEGPDESWAEHRYDGPYLRDSLLDLGVIAETLETATFWSNVPRLYEAVRAALRASLGEPIVLCHVSHVYETGCSLYFTVATGQVGDGIEQWRRAKTAASDAILAAGGTITHHHAVGSDHLPWLIAEIGPVGVAVLRAVKERVDPAGVLNPGVLIP